MAKSCVLRLTWRAKLRVHLDFEPFLYLINQLQNRLKRWTVKSRKFQFSLIITIKNHLNRQSKSMKRLRVSNINPSSPSPTPPPTTTTSTGRRKTKIFVLTPSGEHLPPGEAVKRGLVKRSSCERCRNRKLKCSGPGESGNELCQRCNQDGLECIFCE